MNDEKHQNEKSQGDSEKNEKWEKSQEDYEQEKYEKRQIFEHELINRRLTWLFSSQTILFTALAIVLRNDMQNDKYRKPFFETISWLGIVISIFIFIATLMGAIAKYKSYTDEKKRKTGTKWGVRTPITFIALTPDILMPLVFFAAWICFRSNLEF